ncbi:serine/threonine protein kinase [Amycolatopsis sp.]|uniref:serine/threonine protein kinase n=1 Tax=Amycolatopsis sp. TaxID=37632 RepID=UPI002DF95B05|nr:protein kinase [Amycolatopsis sp.]
MATNPDHGELVPLAQGPVASVFASVRPESGDAVAFKVFPERLAKRTRTELDRELSRLTPLRAQAPILVADGVEELPGGRSALRMELCSQSLPELIGVFGPLSAADAVALGQSVATALAAAHKAGVRHGGVTPGNVLFRPSGEPVLSDFGRALRDAFPRDPMYNVDYLPPETVRDGTSDERSDLYGLGGILHLALTGVAPHPPNRGEQPGEHVLRVLGTPVAPLSRPDLPRGLAELVGALLAKDPAARPADAGAVAAQLGAMFAAPSIVERPEGFDDFASAPPPSPAPRNLGQPLAVSGPRKPERTTTGRTGLVLAVAGTVAVLAVAAVLLIRNDPAEMAIPPASVNTAPPVPVPTSSAAPVVQIELMEPADRGNSVDLAWRSSDDQMDYAVIVAGDEIPQKTLLAQRNHTLSVPVDPLRKYCFSVQATNGLTLAESSPKPIRGATCRG